jgi:hypothetical protein
LEDLHLVDLSLAQLFTEPGLVGPEAELGIPERAVGLGVPRILSVGKSPNTLSRSSPFLRALINAVLLALASSEA